MVRFPQGPKTQQPQNSNVIVCLTRLTNKVFLVNQLHQKKNITAVQLHCMSLAQILREIHAEDIQPLAPLTSYFPLRCPPLTPAKCEN